MVKIGKEITEEELQERLSSNNMNDVDKNDNILNALFFFRYKDYYPGTIIYLDKGEKVSSVIDMIDLNVEKLGIRYYQMGDYRTRTVNLLDDPIDLTNVKFERFPNLKVLDIQWTSIGINNDTLNNCKNLESLNLATPLDYPFDENNCSSLYTLTNLKRLDISGWGGPKVGEGFYKFAKEGHDNKKFEYNYFV